MTSIRPVCAVTVIALFMSCMEPTTEHLWTLNSIAQVETEGYCRDIFISGDSVFVAAGQAGIQLWDISSITVPVKVWEMTLSDLGVSKEITQVEYEASIKQLFALESNERPIHIDLSQGNTAIVLGQFSSEKTKEFRVNTNSSTSFTVFTADNDDGLKWSKFEYDSAFGLWFNSAGGEIPSLGNPNGIDISGSNIVLTLDQLGVESFDSNEGIISSSFHMDLDGNSRAVTIIDSEECYIACEDGGAYRLSPGFSAQWKLKAQFAQDLFVTHVSVDGHQLSLSCASNGLAFYEAKQSGRVEERGIHDIGYVYHTEFSNNYLFAATRQGLQIVEIEE